MKHKIIKYFFIVAILYFAFLLTVVGGIMWFSSQKEHKTINDCINELNQDYDEIRDLICGPPSPFVRIRRYDRSGDVGYDLLGRLQNLESITFKAISNDDVQVYFQELTQLKKLSSVTLQNISGCSIKRLGDIESLSSLCIIYPGQPIDDLELLGTYGSFKNLKSLELYFVHFEAFPDLSELRELESLTIHEYNLTRLEPESVHWENLVYLNICDTHISSIDEEIINRLYNLETLNISDCWITDVSFVLNLPKLKNFSCHRWYDSEFQVDTECLKEHPNFDETWLN